MSRASPLHTAAGFVVVVVMLAFFTVASVFVDARRLVRPVKALARAAVRAFGVRVSVDGLDGLDPDGTYLYASNHVGLLDHFVVLGHLPGYVVGLEKSENAKIPLYGFAGGRWGQVRIDRSSVWSSLESYQTVKDRLDSGIGVVMYPEGTRSPDGRLQPFRPALFQMAAESEAAVVPVALAGLHDRYPLGARFVRPGPVELRLGAPIPTLGTGADARAELERRVRQAMLRQLGQHDTG